MLKPRTVEARRIMGKKVVKGKVYHYEYYTLPMNIYVPKSMIEKFGSHYELSLDYERGYILIRPKKAEFKK